MDKLFDDPPGWETQNMLAVARLVTASARAREESRGVHFRADHPEPDPTRQGRHLTVRREQEGLTTRTE